MSNRVIDLGPYPVVRHHKEEEMFKPKSFGSVPSRMAFQVIRTDEDQPNGQFVTIVRHPYTEDMAASGVDYIKEQHFMLHETSQFLDDRVARYGTRSSGLPMVYGLLSIDGHGEDGKDDAARWFAGIVGSAKRKANGIYDTASKTRFRAIVWSAIDRITAILVPMDSDIYKLEDLGIDVTSNPKAPKRVKRATAPHDVMLRLKLINTERLTDGTRYIILEELTQREFRIKVMDLDTFLPGDLLMADGMGILKVLAQLYGPEYHHVKQTLILPSGVVKGFGHNFDCWGHIEDDAVVYGPKAELTVTDGYVYIGSLGKLKETPAYMDIQSLGNMGFYEPHLAPAEGKFWMDHIQQVRFSEDEDKVRDLDAIFARLSDEKAEKAAEFSNDEDAVDDPELTQPVDQWAAVRAAKLMVESQVLPVLWRRGTQRAFENAVDILHGRILMERVMRRLNICPNPLVFTNTGRPSQALDQLTHVHFPEVPANYMIVCIPDQPEGPVLLWRNPNTTKWEAILVWNVHLPELMKYKHLGFVFFGYGAATLLVRMNGADMDDSVLITSDPAYIAKWQSLEYPVTAKISASETGARANTYDVQENAKHNPPTALWNPRIGDLEVERWRTTKIGLGTVINRCGLDTRLSGENGAHAKAQLEVGLFEAPPNFSCGDPAVFAANECLWFITHRPQFVLRRVAANSEYVIDWFQQHAGNEALAKGLIKESELVLTYKDAQGKLRPIPFFPKSWAKGGKIPRKRLEAGDYLLVETKVCAGLAPLAVQLATILEAARLKEWKLVRSMPNEVDATYPTTDFTKAAVDDLRKKWQKFRDEAKAAGHQHWYKLAANGDDVRQVIKPEDTDYHTDKAGEPQTRPHHIEGLKEHYFYMQNSKGAVIPIPLHHRIGMAVEWFRQVYDVNTLEPRKNPDGTTQSVGDGVPDYILHDLLTAFEACGLTGQAVYAKLDPRAKRRLAANGVSVDVRIVGGQVNTWVIDAVNGLKLGTVAKHIAVPDGTYVMSPQGVIIVKSSDPQLRSSFKVEEIAKRAAGVVDEVDADFEDDDDPYAV